MSRLDVLEEGHGELLGWHDHDEEFEWVARNKKRDLEDKRMSIKEAVLHFVQDGDYLVMGGFGHVRVSMAAIYEIVRQRRRNLTLAAHPGVHDSDILIASGCVSKLEVGYAFGHELRGLIHGAIRIEIQARVPPLGGQAQGI